MIYRLRIYTVCGSVGTTMLVRADRPYGVKAKLCGSVTGVQNYSFSLAFWLTQSVDELNGSVNQLNGSFEGHAKLVFFLSILA